MKLSPEEYWKPILDDLPMQTGEGPATGNIAAFSSENVVVTDLVVSHLLKQAQTQAKAAREIMEYADIWAIDGPMSGLRDNIVFGLDKHGVLVSLHLTTCLSCVKKRVHLSLTHLT